MGTGKEIGSQIWGPEKKKCIPKVGPENKLFSKVGTGRISLGPNF